MRQKGGLVDQGLGRFERIYVVIIRLSLRRFEILVSSRDGPACPQGIFVRTCFIGVIPLEAGDVLVPTALVAVTVNVYAVPFFRFVTM
ncbi:MAG: hypothetical protein ABSF52_21140 [Syntrophobacteraceae bacterium]